ncbi:MAG: FxLYD domain-containing protein, partial [Chloroflexi bacterium]|nr:FxLYD domain-containing protein [Chloroflexota bacterium]
ITVDAVPTDREPRIDLEILNHTGTAGGIYRVTGEVYNPGDPLSAYAEVIATLYNDAGLVVNVGYSFLPAGDLGSGQTAPFEVLVEQPHESIAGYALVVLGF